MDDEIKESTELVDQIIDDVAEEMLEAKSMVVIRPVGIDPGLEAKTYLSTKQVYEIFKVHQIDSIPTCFSIIISDQNLKFVFVKHRE
jgi:hypothetical protein